MKKITDLYHRIYHDERWWTIPNILTFIRIGLAPVLVASMIAGKLEQAFIVVLVASLSDMLDGGVARFTRSTTHLGAFLDPIADKLFLLTTFCSLVFIDSPLLHVPLWFLLLALVREVTIIVGTFFVMIRNTSVNVAPSI
ncbi:MAG: CDP-alcohol phosphatidyltransferase family protein, partial [Candidatus Babeliales bacterium]